MSRTVAEGRGDRRQERRAAREVDPRIAARRQAIEHQRRRRLSRLLLALAVLATLVAAGWWFVHSAGADVDRIDVAGVAHTPPDDVVAVAAVSVGDPLAFVDLDGAARRVEALPWVASARVERSWYGDLTVEVTERTPAAVVVGPSGELLLVDADRRVLTEVPAAGQELPIIEGVGEAAPGSVLPEAAIGALDVAVALPPGLATRVDRVRPVPRADGSLDATPELELTLRPSGTVRLGRAEELAAKIRSLQAVFGQVDLRCLATVDVSVADTPVLTRDDSCQ